ncbi:hypothetical protein HGRIS_011857 [Hohenbuehelia grisea]|uniref:Uncharacterized protein n=1 Tax=Hohenbuehelia grisea TaxID=104357 RepID=A0ABR3JYK3_9AGAR
MVRDFLKPLLSISRDLDINLVIDDHNTTLEAAGAYLDWKNRMHPVEGSDEPPPGIPIPKLNPMQPCWALLKHPWNSTLENLFVVGFFEKHGDTSFDAEDVGKHFQDRLVAIRAVLTKSPERLSAIQTEKRRYQRKVTLLSIRENVVLHHLEAEANNQTWLDAFEMIQHLNAKDMSSDKSDYENESGPLNPALVRRNVTRSRALDQALQDLDAFHRHGLKTPYGNKRPGGTLHNRTRNPSRALESTKPPSPLLPLNYYNPSWYTNLEPRLRDRLRACDAVNIPDFRPFFQQVPI